jgi:hypothetical protein
MPVDEVGGALVLAFTSNSLVKCFAAGVGGRAYAFPVIVGVVAINAAFALLWWFGR